MIKYVLSLFPQYWRTKSWLLEAVVGWKYAPVVTKASLFTTKPRIAQPFSPQVKFSRCGRESEAKAGTKGVLAGVGCALGARLCCAGGVVTRKAKTSICVFIAKAQLGSRKGCERWGQQVL